MIFFFLNIDFYNVRTYTLKSCKMNTMTDAYPHNTSGIL